MPIWWSEAAPQILKFLGARKARPQPPTAKPGFETVSIHFQFVVATFVLLMCSNSVCAQSPPPLPESTSSSQTSSDLPESQSDNAPAPPVDLRAVDKPWDGGDHIDVYFKPSPDDPQGADPDRIILYTIQQAGEYGGHYEEILKIEPTEKHYKKGEVKVSIPKFIRGEPYYFRVRAVDPNGLESDFIETPRDQPVIATRELFNSGRLSLAIIALIICGAVVWFIRYARTGKPLKIRKIAGLEAIEEAVGHATEMGRSCLFIPGLQDMKDIQTIAGLTILAKVSQRAAEYDAVIEVPTCRSLVMTAARETVEGAYLAAGRPDAYNEDRIYYVTDEQFGYVAYLSGMMVREKPAACFYFGAFFAESLILAETGHTIGAIQVAGTAQPAQLPFFVAACDYTLIGEEFFAASAYLSGDPDQLGSLKGQDVGKLIVGAFLIVGCLIATLATVTEVEWFINAAEFVRETILKSGS